MSCIHKWGERCTFRQISAGSFKAPNILNVTDLQENYAHQYCLTCVIVSERNIHLCSHRAVEATERLRVCQECQRIHDQLGGAIWWHSYRLCSRTGWNEDWAESGRGEHWVHGAETWHRLYMCPQDGQWWPDEWPSTGRLLYTWVLWYFNIVIPLFTDNVGMDVCCMKRTTGCVKQYWFS